VSPEAFVDAAEIVVEIVERDRKSVIFKLPRKRVRQPRKSANAHSRQILSFDKTCIDVARIRIAFDAMLPGTSANGGAIRSTR